MITLDLFQFIALAFVTCGLAVLIWEIAVKDPGGIWEIMSDVRQFAERPLTRSTERAGESAEASGSAGSHAADLAAEKTFRPTLPR
jgi:hypothetical protein